MCAIGNTENQQVNLRTWNPVLVHMWFLITIFNKFVTETTRKHYIYQESEGKTLIVLYHSVYKLLFKDLMKSNMYIQNVLLNIMFAGAEYRHPITKD